MPYIDITAQVAQAQIITLRKKLDVMRKNRADFFTRKNELHDAIEAARAAIRDAKEAGNLDAVEANRQSVASYLEKFNLLTEAPPAEGSVQFNAIQKRIAELEAQTADENRSAITDLSDPRITKARASRQAAVGVEEAINNANNERFVIEAAANRLRELDGNP